MWPLLALRTKTRTPPRPDHESSAIAKRELLFETPRFGGLPVPKASWRPRGVPQHGPGETRLLGFSGRFVMAGLPSLRQQRVKVGLQP